MCGYALDVGGDAPFGGLAHGFYGSEVKQVFGDGLVAVGDGDFEGGESERVIGRVSRRKCGVGRDGGGVGAVGFQAARWCRGPYVDGSDGCA